MDNEEDFDFVFWLKVNVLMILLRMRKPYRKPLKSIRYCHYIIFEKNADISILIAAKRF